MFCKYVRKNRNQLILSFFLKAFYKITNDEYVILKFKT